MACMAGKPSWIDREPSTWSSPTPVEGVARRKTRPDAVFCLRLVRLVQHDWCPGRTQQDEALRMPKDLLDLCARKAGRQGWGNEFIPSCAKSEPRLVKTQPGLFQGKASTFELLFLFSHYLSISPPLHPF